MTGDIQRILFSSNATESLRMESRITNAFERNRWAAERGMYYADPDTGKLREIDVYTAQVLNRPQKRKGVGGPLINMRVFCECKSLSGLNVIFSEGKPSIDTLHSDMGYWIGYESELREIILKIAEQARITEYTNIKALYDYAISRAYAYEEMALNTPVSMPPPPVDLVARSFRETKNGKIDDGRTSDQGRANPVWSAIRSTLSAVQAAKTKSRNTSFDYVHGLELRFSGATAFTKSAAFFLDAELLRNTFFHPFVVLNARLWHLNKDQLNAIDSARIYISNINHSNVYVDIVREDSVNDYIDSMVAHYNKSARRSIQNLWRMIDEIEWSPGQATNRLERALGLAKHHPEYVRKRLNRRPRKAKTISATNTISSDSQHGQRDID